MVEAGRSPAPPALAAEVVDSAGEEVCGDEGAHVHGVLTGVFIKRAVVPVVGVREVGLAPRAVYWEVT